MPDPEQCPACGAKKNYRMQLCAGCAAIYGNIRGDWPEWLQFLVSDNDRELYAYGSTLKYTHDKSYLILELLGMADPALS